MISQAESFIRSFCCRVAWFGFDDGSTMVDGLWVQDDPASPVTGLTQDFETVARRIELLGFNAIRIPFSFTDLYTLGPLNYTKPCIHAAPGQVSCCGSHLTDRAAGCIIQSSHHERGSPRDPGSISSNAFCASAGAGECDAP